MSPDSRRAGPDFQGKFPGPAFPFKGCRHGQLKQQEMGLKWHQGRKIWWRGSDK